MYLGMVSRYFFSLLGLQSQKITDLATVDNSFCQDMAFVTCSHPAVTYSHAKVISSHTTVILSHTKYAFSLEKWIDKVLNPVKDLKRRSLHSANLWRLL